MTGINAEEWRAEAMKCRRIIQALPDCLTKQALLDVQIYLSCELADAEAANEFHELIGSAN